MSANLSTALLITAIGMSLLFLALLLFYGLMALLTVRPRRPRIAPRAAAAAPSSPDRAGTLRQAAAVAIALARSRAEAGAEPGDAPGHALPNADGAPSPWWVYHHHRRLKNTPDSERRG